MRKRISCKIIKSVPLEARSGRLRSSVTNLKQLEFNKLGTSTYTSRLVITKTCIDDNPAAWLLDCRA